MTSFIYCQRTGTTAPETQNGTTTVRQPNSNAAQPPLETVSTTAYDTRGQRVTKPMDVQVVSKWHDGDELCC